MPHGTHTESLLIDGRWYECEAKYQQGKLVWRTPLPVAASSNASDFLAVQIQRKKLFFGIESQRNFNVIFQGDRHWYIGETEDGEIEGLGIESVEMEDGTCELYAGQFCQGVRRGHGIILRGVGDFYVGHFDDGLPHGAGFDLSHDRYYAGEMQVSAICMLPASEMCSEPAYTTVWPAARIWRYVDERWHQQRRYFSGSLLVIYLHLVEFLVLISREKSGRRSARASIAQSARVGSVDEVRQEGGPQQVCMGAEW